MHHVTICQIVKRFLLGLGAYFTLRSYYKRPVSLNNYIYAKTLHYTYLGMPEYRDGSIEYGYTIDQLWLWQAAYGNFVGNLRVDFRLKKHRIFYCIMK